MDALSDGPRLSLRDYWTIVRRRRWIIVAFVVVLVGLSVVYSVAKTPVYQATAQLQLTPQVPTAVSEANNISANAAADQVDVPTDTQIIESHVVAQAVAKKLHISAPAVSVTQVGLTNVVNVSVKSTKPGLAAAAANAYALAYIAHQQTVAFSQLNSAEQIVQQSINNLEPSIQSLNSQIANASKSTDVSGLQAQLTAAETQLATLQTELENYHAEAELDSGGGVVISPATKPTKPVSPKPVTYAILAAIIGLVLGVVAALVREYFDDSIRTKTDLEAVVGDLPVLGLLPSISDWRETQSAYLIAREQPKSPPAEGYRSLRTSIQFLGLDRSVRILQFTSPNAADGKTTTLANLAVTMAQAGQRVFVVCCDLRRPRVHQFFGLSNEVGLTSVLLGDASLGDAVQSVPGIPRLQLLASGPIPPNPSELLSTDRVGQTLTALAEHADIVLVDSPPILPVTDAAVLSGKTDGVVVVTAAGISSRKDVSRALESLHRINAPLLGVVLNRASEADSYAYYRYTYGDYDTEPQTNGRNGDGATNGKATPAGAGGPEPRHAPKAD